MAHLAGDETRIDRARPHDARQGRRQRPRARPLRIGHVEHDEIGGTAEQFRRRGKAADEGCVLGAFEQIARRDRRRYAPAYRRRRRVARTAPGAASGFAVGAAIGMRGGGEIGRADRLRCRCRGRANPRHRRHSAGRGAENAVEPRRAARRATASGLSSSSSSRAATACTAASISAICAGKRSRNSPEMRQVTSTRARPIAAVGSTSTPVTRPLAWSQIGRQPISARPCAISSPPVRNVALPHRSITTARGMSPWVCRCARTTSSAARRPSSIAVGVGSVRGSAVNRLRPVGSTSRRPRAGEPAGPGATRRPSSAASNAARSASALACHAGSSTPGGARP